MRSWTDTEGELIDSGESWQVDIELRTELAVLRSHRSRLAEGVEGRDHQAAIEVQIIVLAERLTDADVVARWGPADISVNENWFLAQEGLVASKWLNRPDRHGYKKPSSFWESFLIERRKSPRDESSEFAWHGPRLG